MQNDYIDFKFGDHWASEFNLLAVSSSDRYTPPVYGSVNPNIATIMGKKGVYKWKTQINEKIFNINIAFDSVTIAQLNQIKQWLQPNKIQKLIFSEEPYKYYWAALNAEIDFSHLPFVEGEKQVGERTIIEGVYKGEMVISFVCIDNDGYSTEGTFEGLETENPSSTIKGNDFVLTDADNDYIENLKIEGKSEQETKYNNTLSDTDFANVNSRSVEKAWKTNNLAQIQAENGEVTINAPYQYSGIAQEQREALIDHKYFASAEVNTDSLDTALEIAGKNITNSIEGKDINITDGLVGPVDDLIVSGDASQDKLYNNEINSSFLEDLDNWEEINEAVLNREEQTAIIESDKKYSAVIQKIEESNIGDKYYLSAKIKADSVDTVLEVETEKGNAEGSNITINDASDNKMRDFKLYGKSQQDNYEEEVLGEGEYITYNNDDNYDKYTKIEVNGNSAQEVIEEVLPTIVEGESVTAQGITLPKGRIGVYGNSKQESRSGKNIFNRNADSIGLTYVTEEKIENGIKLNVSNAKPQWAVARYDLINVANFVGKTVRVKAEFTNNNAAGGYYIILTNGETQKTVVDTTRNSGEVLSYVIKEEDVAEYPILRIGLRADNAQESGYVDYKNIIVTIDDEDMSYEEYGAMPSPEYSSPIKVLGNNINLFNASDNFFTRTIAGLTVTPISNDSIIKINGTATADTFSFIGNDIIDIFENGKTYYAYTNNENFEVLFELYGVDVEVPIKTVNNFIMSSEYTIIKLILKGKNLNEKTYNNEEIGIKIEEGKITNYTSYEQGSTKIKITNENIANINEIYTNMKSHSPGNCVEETVDGRDCLRFANSRFRPDVENPFNLINYKYKEKTAYTFRMLAKAGKQPEGVEGSGALTFQAVYTDGSKISATKHKANATSFVELRFVTDPEKTVARVGFNYGTSCQWYMDKSSVFIAEGDTTNYIEHQEKNYILPIQKPMLEGDYFDFKKGKEIHNWEKVVLDGTEPWELSTLTNYQWFGWSLSGVKHGSDFVCTHLKTYNSIGSSNANYIGITNNSTPNRIYIAISKDITTVEQLKKYLAELKANNNPIVVYYQKTEIEELPLTEEQIEIGEQIAETELFLDTTNIYSNDEIAPNFKLEYNYVLPSPSPEVPSNIRNVGDNINLINKNQPLHYSTYGSSLDNTVLVNNTNYTGYLFKCKPNTVYTISRGDVNSARFRAFCFDEDPTLNLNAISTNGFWGDEAANRTGYAKSFKTTENSKYIYVVAGYNDELSTNIKAEEGSELTSYSNYNCGNIEITLSTKNIANAEQLYQDMLNFNPNVRKEVVDGRNCLVFSNMIFMSNKGFKGLQGKYKENTRYVVRAKCRVQNTSITSGMSLMIGAYDKEGKGIGYHTNGANGANWIQFSFLTNADASVDYIAFSYGNNTMWCLDMDSLEIYEATKVEDYVANEQQQLIFPLAQGQKLMLGDYLDDDGIHHVRKQVELDGTEDWEKDSNRDDVETDYFYILNTLNMDLDKAKEFLCTHFAYEGDVHGQQGFCSTKVFVIKINKEYTGIIAGDSTTTRINKFKNYLAQQKEVGTPVIVEYKLLEEEIEEYTEEQREAYNLLSYLTLYEGYNIIYSPNEIKPQLKWKIPESPSPDYFIEIENVTDDIDVTVCNKNLFDEQWSETTSKNFIKVFAGKKYIYSESEIGQAMNYRFYESKSGSYVTKWITANSIYVPEKDGFVKLYKPTTTKTKCMLEAGEVVTDYVPNEQQTVTFPLAEGQRLMKGSYLASDGIHHVRKQLELDGTENITINQETYNVFKINGINDIGNNGNLTSVYGYYCSHFKEDSQANLRKNKIGFSAIGEGVNAIYLGFSSYSKVNSVEACKSFLSQQKQIGTPVIVEYELVEEEMEPYTPEQQEAYNQLCTHREITYIQTTNKFQPNMQIEYTKKPQYQSQLTAANTQQTLSLIYQTNIDDTRILISNIDSNPNTIEFTNPVLINLTKTFGEGKEPTKDWCDQNLTFFKCEEGGAPSVETSSRVKTVGGNINLFDPDNHIEFDGQYRGLDGNIHTNSELFGLKIPVLGNTVYSVNSNLARGQYHNFGFLDKEGEYMWRLIDFTNNNKTFRTPKNCGYVYLAINKNYDWFTLTYGEVPIQKADYNLANIDMQISGYDSQFKSFPLAKGQELLQLSNGTQDTLEADGIHKRVGKVEITGNENWGQYNRQLHTYFGAVVRITGTKAPIFCNRLIANNEYVYNTTGEAAACLQDGYLYMCIKREDFGANDNMSVDECLPLFKQFLKDEYSKGNPFIYYYRKAEEEVIPYSNAQKAWYDEFEIYRKNTQITTIAETKPWYSFTYDINDTYSVNSTKVNEYEKLGLIFNNLEDRPRFIVNRTAEGSGTIKMRKPLVVDLTNAFGAGKEPDLTWCLENITFDNSCEYGTPSPNVPSELISVGSNPIKIENKSRNLIKEQNLLNWTKEYCTAERLTEKYDNRNIYRISFENHKKGTISTRIQQKKGNMVLSIYARVIQADDPTVNRLVVAKVTSDSSSSTPVSHKSLENLIGEWQKIYIPITAESINDAAELVLEVQHNADTDDSTIIDLCMPQLEEGFTPHDYIPYAPEKVNNLIFTTPLRQLKNGVRDEFSKDGIIRRIGEHTIKSTDTVYWIVFNQDKDYVTICGQLGIYVRGDSSWNAPSFYCNRIEDCTSLYRIAQAKNPAPSRTKEGIGIIDSEYRMCLRADLMGIVETDTEEDMIRKYKVLLDEKPFIIYYEKEVADIEPLTELQKNTLANLVTRKQYDHWLVSGDLNPEIELSYKLTSSINDIHPWVTGSNLLDKTWFYNDNNIHTKPYVEVDTGDADKSGISATRPIYLLNSGTETANLSLTFDYINIETPLTIQTYSGKFTDDGFVEEAKVSEITIEPFTNYQPFKDIYDNNPANWKIEIDSALGEVYLRHNTDETKVLNLNRFNKDHTFLSLADCNFVDYDKVFPTIISEIEGTAIENTIFNKVIVANTADNYRLKNVNVEWKHTYL